MALQSLFYTLMIMRVKTLENVHISPAKEEKSRRDGFKSPVGFPRCPVHSIHHYRKQSVTTSSSASPAVLAVKYVLDWEVLQLMIDTQPQ